LNTAWLSSETKAAIRNRPSSRNCHFSPYDKVPTIEGQFVLFNIACAGVLNLETAVDRFLSSPKPHEY
jgi:hypothetical protein